VKYRICSLRVLFAIFMFSTLLSTAAFAAGSHDRTQFGHDIVVGPGEDIGEAVCIGCTVRVRGQVSGDVTVIGGSIVVEDQGLISGDATAFGGGMRLEGQAKVNGDMTIFGGHIRRDPQASVGGDVTNFSGTGWVILVVVLPCAILGAFIALIVWVIRRVTRQSVPAAA
jgi:hypothetical protein